MTQMALNEENAQLRAMLRDTCAVVDAGKLALSPGVAKWWQAEQTEMAEERRRQEAVMAAKRAQIEEQIARLQTELAGL